MNDKEQENKAKRARSENWLEEDKLLLKELIKERYDVLENKNTDTKTNKKKEMGWADLQKSFNSMCTGAERTVTQLKNQWGHIKMDAKKTKSNPLWSDFGKQITTTSGETAPQPENADEVEKEEFVTPNVKRDFETEIDDPLVTMPLVTMPLVTIPLVTIPETETAEQVEYVLFETAEEPKPVKKSKKKRKRMSAAEEQIVAVEIKCRKELHEAQMRNEKFKNDNIITEQEILQMKKEYYKIQLEILNENNN